MVSLIPAQEMPGTKNNTCSTGGGKEGEWVPGFSPRLCSTQPGLPASQ